MMRFILYLSIVSFSGVAQCSLLNFEFPQNVESGVCPTPNAEVVDLEKFSGIWYQVLEVPNHYVEVEECIRTKYNFNGSALLVLTEGLNEYDERTDQTAVLSIFQPMDTSKKPYLQLTAENVPIVPYYILNTDYVEYACVYSCFEVIELKVQIYTVLTRSPSPSEESLSTCKESFQNLDLDLRRLREVQQGEKCWYNDEGEAQGEEPLDSSQGSPSDFQNRTRDGVDTNGNGKAVESSSGRNSLDDDHHHDHQHHNTDGDGDPASDDELTPLLGQLEESEELTEHKEIRVGEDTIVRLDIKKIINPSKDSEVNTKKPVKSEEKVEQLESKPGDGVESSQQLEGTSQGPRGIIALECQDNKSDKCLGNSAPHSTKTERHWCSLTVLVITLTTTISSTLWN